MVAITYNVYIDLNRDGDFADANEDITSYVKRCSIQRGASKPYDTIARDTSISLVLDNSDGRFSPEASGGLAGLQPGALVKVDMTYNSVTVTLGIGRIARDGIDVTVGTKAERETTIRTFGLLRLLQEERTVVLPLLEDQRTDQIVSTIIDQIGVYPFSAQGWVLELDGYTELDTMTVFPDATDYLDLDAGDTVCAYIGDQWGAEVSAYGMLRDAVDAERGLLYEKRDGSLAMRSRGWFIEAPGETIAATLSGTDLITRKKQDYRYGSEVINAVSVTAYPRKVATARTTVARLPIASGTGEIVVAGTTRSFTLSYANSTGDAIGAKQVLCVENTDYALDVWDSVNQQIIAGSPNVTLTVTEGAGSVRLDFTNNEATLNAIIVPGSTDANALAVRGYAIETFDTVTASAEDADSIAAVLRQPLRLDLKLVTDAETAQNLALYELAQRGQLRGAMETVTLAAGKSAQHAAWVRDLTIGSVISVSEAQTDVNLRHVIVGEAHEIFNGGTEHYASYTLRPVQPTFVVLDETGWSELDDVTLSA